MLCAEVASKPASLPINTLSLPVKVAPLAAPEPITTLSSIEVAEEATPRPIRTFLVPVTVSPAKAPTAVF